MNTQPFSFSLRLEDFDLSRLPISADVLRADRDLLVQAISKWFFRNYLVNFHWVCLRDEREEAFRVDF